LVAAKAAPSNPRNNKSPTTAPTGALATAVGALPSRPFRYVSDKSITDPVGQLMTNAVAELEAWKSDASDRVDGTARTYAGSIPMEVDVCWIMSPTSPAVFPWKLTITEATDKGLVAVLVNAQTSTARIFTMSKSWNPAVAVVVKKNESSRFWNVITTPVATALLR